MARIRTLKPEFWEDEKLGPMDPLTRLVFVGLISQADDAGRIVDSVRRLDGILFPYTDDSCAASLVKLEEVGVIQRGTAESGLRVIQIVGWAKHQRVEKPNLKGVTPPIHDHSGKLPGSVGEASGKRRGSFPSTARAGDEQRPTSSEQRACAHADPTAPAREAATAATEPLSEQPASPPTDQDAVSEIIRRANRVMSETLGDACRPIPISHGSRQEVIDWLAEGIPADAVLSVVEAKVRAYRPTQRSPNPSSMKYFDGAVRDAWDRRHQSTGNGAAPTAPRDEYDMSWAEGLH